jgi:hypothetical protein
MLEQRAEECIEICAEYVQQIPSLFALACFLSVRAKDFSAPPLTTHPNLVPRYKNELRYIILLRLPVFMACHRLNIIIHFCIN